MLPTQPAISPFLGYNVQRRRIARHRRHARQEQLLCLSQLHHQHQYRRARSADRLRPMATRSPFGSPARSIPRNLTMAPATACSRSIQPETAAFKPINFTNIENLPQVSSPGVWAEQFDHRRIGRRHFQQAARQSAESAGAQQLGIKQLEYEFYAFEQTYRGGVHVAVADVTGDGVPDLIVTPGIGRVGEVKVYDGAQLASMAVGGFVSTPDAALLADFTPEGPAYKNGLICGRRRLQWRRAGRFCHLVAARRSQDRRVLQPGRWCVQHDSRFLVRSVCENGQRRRDCRRRYQWRRRR